MKKKSLILSLLLALIIVLTACDNNSSENDSLTIGINQLAEHPALDQVRDGFMDYFEDKNHKIKIDLKNAQGDIPNSLDIAEKFVRDKVDLIFAIATPSAQSSKQVTSSIPIVFSAVTDPVEAGLVEDFVKPSTNVTGTSDESPIEEQLSLFREIDPSIKTIGIIYNTAESNSAIQIKQAEEIAKKLNLNLETIGVTNINEISQAMDSLVKKVDGIYTITDNMIASAINLVADKAIENNIITVGAEEAHIKGGILLTKGISYYQLGRQSARMAEEILLNNKNISDYPCEKSEVIESIYNENTLSALGVDPNIEVFVGSEKVN